MNTLNEISILTMPREEALEGFAKYKEAVKRSRSAADKLMVKTYESLAAGHGVLNLAEAIKKGGVDPQTCLPRLAVMRVDCKECWFHRGNNGAGVYSFDSNSCTPHRTKSFQNARMVFTFQEGVFPMATANQPKGYWWKHRAPVPPVPPEYRPADALSKYVILWEVQTWEMIAPEDPILLKPISSDLYAVMAHWDLTPVEKLVVGSLLGVGSGS